MGQGWQGFLAIVLVAALFTIVYADEIVNFTLNKSRPANPFLFPLEKTDQITDEQQQNVSGEEQNKDGRGIIEKIVDVAKSVKKKISESLNNKAASCRAGESRGVLSAASCKALATIKTGCEVDSNCADPLAVCDQSFNHCIKPSGCINLINSGDPLVKADLVFVGDGYYYDSQLKEAVLKIVDRDGTSRGFTSLEPFKSNKNKFNVWMIRGYNITTNEDGGPDRKTSRQFGEECNVTNYITVLSKKNFRSYAYIGEGDAYLSLTNESESHWGLLFLHEFGHSFGGLVDEYVEEIRGNWWRRPNCAPDITTAKEWWGGTPNTGYYPGCSYVETNIRPTPNSIMRDHLTGNGYGEVNKGHLKNITNGYG